MPINAERWVVVSDAAFVRFAVYIVAFVLKNGGFGQHRVAMRKTTRHKKLRMIFGTQHDGKPLLVGFGIGSQIDGYI